MAPRLSVITCLWPGPRDYRPAYVNALARSVRRQLSLPHRFVCLHTGVDVDAFDTRVVEPVAFPPAAEALGRLRTPEGARFPTSYRRLWLFSGEAAEHFPGHVLLLDVDCVAVDRLEPLVERGLAQDFTGWRPSSRWGTPGRLGGGTWMLRTGAHTRVWQDFVANPPYAIHDAAAAGYRGSDQAWLSYCLPRAPAWSARHGIYQAQDMRIRPHQPTPPEWPLPGDDGPHGRARLVHFNGPKAKPWTVPHWSWVAEHWREADDEEATA